MRALFTYLLLIAIAFGLTAQTKLKMKSSSGEIWQKYTNRHPYQTYPIGYDEQGVIYRIYENGNKNKFDGMTLKLQKTDFQSKLIISNDIHLPKDLYFASLVSLQMIGGKLFLIYVRVLFKERMYVCYRWHINTRTLKLEGDPEFLMDADPSSISKFHTYDFLLTYSPDSSKILLWYELRSMNAEVNPGIGVSVFDADNFNVIWSKKNIIYKQDFISHAKTLKVDNQGNVYMVYNSFRCSQDYHSFESFKVRMVNVRSSVSLYKPVFKMWVMKIDSSGTISNAEITIKEGFVYWLDVFLTPEGNAFLVGLYSKSGKISPQGAFSHLWNGDGPSVQVKNKFEFTKEFITNGMTEVELKEYEEDVLNGREYDFHAYFFRGMKKVGTEYVVMLEQIMIFYADVKLINTLQIYKYSLADDILLFFLSAQADFNEIKKIPKRQVTIGLEDLVSFQCMEIDGNLLFLFNDLYLSSEGLLSKNTVTGANFIVAILDKKRKLDINKVDAYSKYSGFPCFNSAILTSGNTYYFNTIDHLNNQRPGSVTIMQSN